MLVYLTALDSSSDFLAVGSSIGMLYLYCRRVAHMNKYSMEVRAPSMLSSISPRSFIIKKSQTVFGSVYDQNLPHVPLQEYSQPLKFSMFCNVTTTNLKLFQV